MIPGTLLQGSLLPPVTFLLSSKGPAMLMPRRRFLTRSLQAVAVAGLTGFSRSALRAAGSVLNESQYEILSVDRTTVKLEYRPVPRRHMDRELPHWRHIELCDVKLRSGHTGTGETMLFYTWGATQDDDVARVIGHSAIEMMWDDSLGAGLQMALFDAVGRTADVPVHALLAEQHHQTTPLSWWNIDTSAEDMAAECRTAMQLGYQSYKTKGRPWFDILQQVRLSASGVPENFRIDMDFNDTLRTAAQGLPILQELEKFPQVDIYESPIPQEDIAGNRLITDSTRVKVAMHYGNPAPATVVRSGCCDGFVAGGGASKLLGIGKFCEEVELPFWLQLVGAGLTAAWSLHFGGALRQAVWPAVNCHQLFENDLLTQPIVLTDGHAAVPDQPGLGYQVNRDVVARLQVPKPESRPEPERLIETTWADGTRMFTASNGKVNFMLTAANQDKYPYYAPGADTRLVPNDGSAEWRARYTRAREQGPFRG